MKRYSFKEAQLGEDFAREKLIKIKQFIESSTSFTILGMPGVGVSYFLRYLASSNLACFVFVDSFALSTLSKREYLSWLLHELGGKAKNLTEQQIYEECKKRLEILAKKYPKIVIIFNRFDQLFAQPTDQFDKLFLANLRSLRQISPDKIVMIFTANKPLYEICPDAIIGSNLNFYSQLFYFGIYTEKDLYKLLKITQPDISNSDAKTRILMKLSGGHNQLLHIILKSESQENLLADKFVKLQLREIYESLNVQNRKTLQRIASSKDPHEVDSYLVNIGMVLKEKSGYRLFTPLLKEYISSTIDVKIAAKEGKLFKLLKKNLGRVVPKDELFEDIWKDDFDNASDWALNALVYRLRKNPKFKLMGYSIENHKKIGYMLSKN